jgi:hypothetical protein
VFLANKAVVMAGHQAVEQFQLKTTDPDEIFVGGQVIVNPVRNDYRFTLHIGREDRLVGDRSAKERR